jgi:hypothetical protein
MKLPWFVKSFESQFKYKLAKPAKTYITGYLTSTKSYLLFAQQGNSTQLHNHADCPAAKRYTGFFKMTRRSIGGKLFKNESADKFKKSIFESRQGVKKGRLMEFPGIQG